MSDISDRLLNELVDAVREIVRKEQSDRLRDIYLIGDIEKDSARHVIERIRAGVHDPSKAYLTVFNSTPHERKLAVLLGVPLNGCDPQLAGRSRDRAGVPRGAA